MLHIIFHLFKNYLRKNVLVQLVNFKCNGMTTPIISLPLRSTARVIFLHQHTYIYIFHIRCMEHVLNNIDITGMRH